MEPRQHCHQLWELSVPKSELTSQTDLPGTVGRRPWDCSISGLPGHCSRYCWLPRQHSGQGFACQCRRCKRHGFNPWVGKISWEEKMATGSKSLAWRIPWAEDPGGLQSGVCKELDITMVVLHHQCCITAAAVTRRARFALGNISVL